MKKLDVLHAEYVRMEGDRDNRAGGGSPAGVVAGARARAARRRNWTHRNYFRRRRAGSLNGARDFFGAAVGQRRCKHHLHVVIGWPGDRDPIFHVVIVMLKAALGVSLNSSDMEYRIAIIRPEMRRHGGAP